MSSQTYLTDTGTIVDSHTGVEVNVFISVVVPDKYTLDKKEFENAAEGAALRVLEDCVYEI